MIQRAKISEIPDILSLTKACERSMTEKGIYQWNEHYPSRAIFEKDIERNELYVLKLYNKVIGTVVLSVFMDEEYMAITWLTHNENNLYIHRLAIHPKYQGKGYAQKLMDFAEDFAKRNNYSSIRLDTFSQNRRNQKFYETRGYRKLGDIYFLKQSRHPFHCFELVL